MKQLEVFKKIGGIINELSEQYKYIESNNPEDINDLELELFIANAHFLTDHAEILHKVNQRNRKENADIKAIEREAQQLPPYIAPPAPKLQPPAIVEPPKPVVQPLPQTTAKPLSKNAEQVERALAKIKELTAEKFFEPVVQQPKRDVKPVEPVEEEETPTIDITPSAPKDTYSFEMQEPEVIRHELVVDESADEDEELVEEVVAEDDTVDEEGIRAEDEVVQEGPPVIETPVVETPPAADHEDAEERIAIELGKDPIVEPAKPEIKAEEPAKEKDEVFTINQRISAQLGSHSNASDQANAQPVTNLKQAITLNDKLLYIKDLFNGYSLAYSEAIEILNRFNTFEEANRFLNKNYTTKNNWDAKPDTTAKFFALLKRRYS